MSYKTYVSNFFNFSNFSNFTPGSAMWGTSRGFPTCREHDVGYIEGISICRERDVGHIEGNRLVNNSANLRKNN